MSTDLGQRVTHKKFGETSVAPTRMRARAEVAGRPAMDGEDGEDEPPAAREEIIG